MIFKEVFCSLFFISLLSSYKCSTGKLVIDNDAGGDDAMAIFIALLFEKYHDGKELVALTTGNGNTNEENVNINNQRVLKVAKRQDIPIYRGSTCSIVTTPGTTAFYGEDGLGDSCEHISDLKPAQEGHAVQKLIELSKIYEGHLTVVTIGTLTNVALAMTIDPNFLGRLEHLYVGAGHIAGEKFPNPEFNAHMDVEAYHIVVENASPDKVTVLPFSQTQESAKFSIDWRKNVLGAIDTDIMKAQNRFEGLVLLKNTFWAALDPALVSLVMKPDLIEESNYSKNGIILCGKNRGLNSNTFVGIEDANIRIIKSLKTEEYKQFLLDIFSTELKNKTRIN